MSREPEKKMSLEEFGAAIDAQTRTLPVRESEAPRTVRVRIAVAIGHNGFYGAYGSHTSAAWYQLGKERRDREIMGAAHECLGVVPVMSCWIEADVPLPATQTIHGEVVQ